MNTIWFIIYMTLFGWQVVQVDPVPGLQEQCYYNDRGADFCIVSVEFNPNVPSKTNP